MGSFTNKTIQVVMAMAEGVFQNGANQITVEGLPTTVDIQKQGGDERPSCTVTIGNLNIDVVKQLTTLSFRPLQRFKNQITVNAGEVGKQLQTIFIGDFENAYGEFQNAPTMNLMVKAIAAQHGALMATPATSVDGTEQVAKLMEQWAVEAGCTLENKGVNASVKNVVYRGSPVDKAKTLARDVGIDLIIDDGKFIITPNGQAVDGNAVLIDPKHGLLGYPAFSNDGIEFNMIFDPNVKIGGLVKIESIVPRASGIWKVTKITTKLEAYVPNGGSWNSSVSATWVQEESNDAKQG
jgi:hypothetical protein